MKYSLTVVYFLIMITLYVVSCIDRSDDSGNNKTTARIPDLPINEEVTIEVDQQAEQQLTITEEDIKRIDQIPITLVLKYTKEEAVATLTENKVEIGTRQLVDSCLLKSRKLEVLLIKAGVDPNTPASDNRYPILAACHGGNTEIITDLIENGARLDVTRGAEATPCIHYAAQSGNKKAVDLLIQHGVKVDDRNGWDQTTLMTVCALGMHDMAEYLISLGADINARDRNDRGPLHSAVNAGALPIVTMLVDKGADINRLDKQAGMSPIYAAALMGYEDVFKFLLEAGADLQKETRNGINIIHAACITQSKEIVEILLERGFDINDYCQENGGRPILAALEANEVEREFVKFLVEKGADVNVFNKIGYCPLSLAAVNGDVDIFNDLLAAGADPKAVNNEGIPLLHFVIMNDNAEMVQTMIDVGVDIYAKDNEGKTALDRSIEYSCKNSERVLREAMGIPRLQRETNKENPGEIAG